MWPANIPDLIFDLVNRAIAATSLKRRRALRQGEMIG